MTDTALAEVLERWQAGNVSAAEALCRDRLAAEPGNGEYAYLLGTIVLQDRGDAAEASALFTQAASLNPADPRYANALGIVSMMSSDLAAAESCFLRALDLDAGNIETLRCLGGLRMLENDPAAAAAAYRAAVALSPDDSELLGELATVQLQRGEVDEAISLFEQILVVRPEAIDAQIRLALAHQQRGDLIAARDAFRAAVERRPDFAATHRGLARVNHAMGNLDDAVDGFRRALELESDNAVLFNDLGVSLSDRRHHAEALAAFENAARLKPEWNVPWHNMGVMFAALGERVRAMEMYRHSAALASPAPSSHLNLGMMLLQRGEFSEGWKEYEWRWSAGGNVLARPELQVPLWDGSPLAGRTLLLWCEQGFGDILQFVRFVALVPKDGGRIVLHAPRRLARVLATCSGVDRVVIDGEWFDADLQFPLLSLPFLFDAVPGPYGAYLSAPPEGSTNAERAVERGAAFHVGFLWASGKLYRNHGSRDCPLALLAGLADIPGVQLFSFQYDERSSDVTALGVPIVDLAPLLGDFYSTAAFIKRMDLIITVDTAMPHLAGALGVPVWTLLHDDPDWRWMVGRSDSPWYATMRLYRQSAAGDWEGVIERVRRDLRELAGARGAAPSLPKSIPSRRTQPPPSTQVFIKQYGERRTGTNYIRAALQDNYVDIHVLMHILGDKHSPPVPLAQLRREAAAHPDPSWTFISQSTFGAPAASTRAFDRDQSLELRRLAGPLTEAFDRGELRYLVTIKDPYAWAVSVARFSGWMRGTAGMPDGCADALAQSCRKFNRNYAAWIALADKHAERAWIVRYEDLVADPDAAFHRIGAHFALTPRAPQWKSIPGVVLPAQWDDSSTPTSDAPFDREYYLERRYLHLLPQRHREVIAETIDWPLLRRFGYAPLN